MSFGVCSKNFDDVSDAGNLVREARKPCAGAEAGLAIRQQLQRSLSKLARYRAGVAKLVLGCAC